MNNVWFQFISFFSLVSALCCHARLRRCAEIPGMPRLRSSPISSSADQPLSWRNDAAYGDDNYCGWKEKKPAVGIPLGLPMKHWDYKDISSIYQLVQDFVTMRNISSRARNAQQTPSSMFALKKSARIKGTLSLWRMLWHGSVPGTPAGAGLGPGVGLFFLWIRTFLQSAAIRSMHSAH